MITRLAAFVAAILPLQFVYGTDAQFSAAVAPLRQKHDDPRTPDLTGVSVISVPTESKMRNVDAEGASRNHFFVVVSNRSDEAITLTMDTANWYSCIEIVVTTSKGKTFTIRRDQANWFANGPEPWKFHVGGARVFLIDFVSGGWSGFPSEAEMFRREPFHVKAVFTYPDPATKKLIRVESPTIVAAEE